MGLFKKFWNTDIIGKIYILIILFIVIVATITVITRYRNANLNTENNEIMSEQVNNINPEDIEQSQENKSNDLAFVQESIVETQINQVQTVSREEKNTNDNKSTYINKQNNKLQSTTNEIETNVKEESTSNINKQVVETPVKQEVEETKTEETKQEKIIKEENSVEQQEETVKLDFSKYDRYYSALNRWIFLL